LLQYLSEIRAPGTGNVEATEYQGALRLGDNSGLVGAVKGFLVAGDRRGSATSGDAERDRGQADASTQKHSASRRRPA
jgi:hypothetical protein